MNSLQYRQEKIQAKRKQTPWREFVMEIASWKSLMFYKNSGMISVYPIERVHKVVKSGQYYDQISIIDDIGESFFENMIELVNQNGYPATNLMQIENSEFSDTTIRSKNIYLSNTVITECENVMYSLSVKDKSSNIFNSIMVWKNCESIYNSRCIIESYNVYYSNNIHGSNNIRFSSNLIGCSECILCDDLSNQSYCIQNKFYTKEEYQKLKQKLLQQKNVFHNKYGKQGHNIASTNIIGNSNIECIDCENTFLSFNTQKGKNLILMGSSEGASDVYDCITGGSPYAHDFYAVMGAGASEHVYCSIFINGGSSNIYYSMDIESCSFCLGCIGLKNKSYCILNKQYTKEERYQKIDEIFQKMEDEGTLGEFFPASMNPFYFNDTAAYLIDNSFTKEEVTTKGYLWRDEPIKVDVPEGAKVVKTNELDQYEGRKDASSGTIVKDLTAGSGDASTSSAGRIRWIDPEILKVIIQDDQGNIYKIVKMEYDFLVKHGLPLPRQHRLDRMKNNFKI